MGFHLFERSLLFSAFVLLAAYATARTCDFPAIFNFGDSNSDTGGLSASFGQVGPPSGETYFRHPAGRYCDGRLVIDFIGKEITSNLCTHFFQFAYMFMLFIILRFIVYQNLHLHMHDNFNYKGEITCFS